MDLSILVTLLAFCRNTGSGKVRICKTAILPMKIRLDFYLIPIIPLLAAENHISYSRLTRNASLPCEPSASVILSIEAIL